MCKEILRIAEINCMPFIFEDKKKILSPDSQGQNMFITQFFFWKMSSKKYFSSLRDVTK